MLIRIGTFVLLLALVSVLGCGAPPVGTVQGKVTYKDAPVTNGSVIYQNAGGTVSMSANLNADGTYVITSADRKGLPPGDYKVAVNPNKIGSGEVPLAVAPGQTPAGPPPVPTKYHSIETSDLKATVKAGENPPFNFNLAD
jgi:hypothetical protein